MLAATTENTQDVQASRRSAPEFFSTWKTTGAATVETTSSHVLVVDDDPDVCSRLSAYLSQHDFRVTAVNTGKQMLEVIGREAIDLLLLEARLRGDDGLRLTLNLRDKSRMPIVVLSDLIEEADRVMGLELGADDYVTKPFSPRELLARIRAVLRRSQSGCWVAMNRCVPTVSRAGS
jgi:DNA-binding response OmpR family regulator